MDRLWGPEVYKNVNDYEKSCEVCQHAQRLPTYRTNLQAPIAGLFETFSMDFAGPFKPSREGKKFAIIAVEHITEWQVAWATSNASSYVVIDFVMEEVALPFGPLRRIFHDNCNRVRRRTCEVVPE